MTFADEIAKFQKPAKRHQITISVPEHTHQAIAATAEAYGVTPADVVRAAVNHALGESNGSSALTPPSADDGDSDEEAPAQKPKPRRSRTRQRTEKPAPAKEEPEDSEADDFDGESDESDSDNDADDDWDD